MKKIHFMLMALLAAVILVPAVLSCGGEETATTAAGEYDINTIIADIEVNPEVKAMLPDSIQANGVVKVASDIPWPPWEMFVSEGSDEITGFDYDLGQALGAVLGVEFEFVQTPFDGIIPSLESGKNDIIMSAMYDNLSRREVVDFVDYAYDGTSMLVMAGNPEGITDLESLAGKTVGCEIGTTQAVLLKNVNEQLKSAGEAEMDVQEYDTGPEAILALQSGRIVAYLADHSTAMYTSQTEQGGSLFDVVTDPANPHGYNPQIDGIGVLKGNDQLRDAIQKALQVLIDTGVYTQIIDYYGLLPVDSAEVNQGTDPGE